MPRKIKKTLDEMVIETYVEGETDLRKIGRQHDITSEQVMQILENNGLI